MEFAADEVEQSFHIALRPEGELLCAGSFPIQQKVPAGADAEMPDFSLAHGGIYEETGG